MKAHVRKLVHEEKSGHEGKLGHEGGSTKIISYKLSSSNISTFRTRNMSHLLDLLVCLNRKWNYLDFPDWLS